MIQTIFYDIASKIKIQKLTRKLQINPHFLNDLAIHHFSRLFKGKVDDKLIVLGAINGKAFIGNTKYIYNYLTKNTNYKVFWFANSKTLIKELKGKGINVINTKSLDAIKILRKAHFIFTTHGLTDILPIRFSPRTINVETWHGIQNKKNKTEGEMYLYPKLSKLLGLKTRNRDVIDYFITPSGTVKDREIITHHFELPKERVLATGFPRNDILFSKDPNLENIIKTKHKIPKEIEKIFLYAPTFRDNTLTAKFPLKEADLNELNDLLKKQKSILLLKAHLAEIQVFFKNLTNIFEVEQDSDIQELLFISDALITDYSSTYCDYLLLNRPILLFTYDYDEFMKTGRGFYYDFKETAPGPLLYTGKELIEAIKNISEIDKEYEKKRIETRKIYHKNVDGNSAERLLKFLKIIK